MPERTASPPRSPFLPAMPADELGAPATVRAQTAVVRALADAVAQAGLPVETMDALRQQLAEETTRLHSCIERAAAEDPARAAR